MSSPDSPGWDPGLQNVRTTLAWVRTALSFVAAGTLAGKQTGAGVTFAALVMASLAAAAVMVVTAERRYPHRYDRARNDTVRGKGVANGVNPGWSQSLNKK